MARFRMRKRSSASSAWRTTGRLLIDALRFVSLGFRSRSRLAAENLFLRKQLALYAERRVKSRRADDTTRLTLVVLSRLIDWRAALIIVKPATLIRLVGSGTGAVIRRQLLGRVRGFPLRARVGAAVIPFPVPATSHAACGFPALRAPAPLRDKGYEAYRAWSD